MGKPPRIRKLHPEHERCADWGEQASYSASVWEGPILAQLSGLEISDETIEKVARLVTEPDQLEAPLQRAQEERQRRDSATQFASGRITQEQFIAAIAVIDAAQDSRPVTTEPSVDAAQVAEVLRNFSTTWRQVGLPLKERQALIHAIYDSITVRGNDFVGVRLTPNAEAHGFTLALPEQVECVLARPTGVGRAITAYRMPIEGRDEWLAAARRLA